MRFIVAYWALPIFFLLTVLQTAVLPHFPIFGFVPHVTLLVALVWGLLRDVDEALMWAFVGGLLLDIFSLTPVGLTSLAYIVAILAVVWIERVFPASQFFLPIVQAIVATIIFLLCYALLTTFWFQYSGSDLTWNKALATAVALAPTALIHGFLILPLYWGILAVRRLIQQPRRPRL